MNEVRVIYSDLRLQHSSQPQRRQRPEISEKKGSLCFRHQDCPTPASSWKLIAVILCLICLMLLLSVGILAIKLNQKSFQAERCLRNLSSSKEADKTVWKYPTCSNNWHQHGENCYYFSRNMFPWKECQRYCAGLASRFLKLNIQEEMDFVIKLSKMQCDMRQEKFLISLYYNSKQLKWVWLDGTDLTLDKLQIPGHVNANNKCVHIKYGQMNAEDCQSYGYCICKKTTYSD
ncbi:natural killer cells antigen CD94-like [Equus przewalskii]|uniref:Natural killer cells antigen CD94-like n=1 Tax=Equus przewalskii TaxID=9798 RepID=A0ABM4PDB9_EQUPR